MLAAQFIRVAVSPAIKTSFPAIRTALAKPIVFSKNTFKYHEIVRSFAEDTRQISRAARRKTLREQAMAPAGEAAFNIGKGAVAGGAVVGLGALCFYGLGLSSQTGAIDHAMLWPQYVKERIKSTYMYFGGSIVVSVASAVAVFRTPVLLNMFASGGFVSLAITMAALIGTGMVLNSIPYEPGFGAKQLAWMGHSALIGAVIAPMAVLGGPILLRAAWYTAGIVSGLSAVAVCAPSEKFLMMGGPLAIGLGVVFASSLGTMFLPPTTALGAGLYSISLYGGLLLFSGFLLYDTQRIIRSAETHPKDGWTSRSFDPVSASVSIYLDTINIFIRLATILSGGGGNRKR